MKKIRHKEVTMRDSNKQQIPVDIHFPVNILLHDNKKYQVGHHLYREKKQLTRERHEYSHWDIRFAALMP